MPIPLAEIRSREKHFPLFLVAVVLPLLALPFAKLQGTPLERFALPTSVVLLNLQSIRAMPSWRCRWGPISLNGCYRLLGVLGAISAWVPFVIQHNVPMPMRIGFVLIRTVFYGMTAVRIIDVLASSQRVNGNSLCLGAAGYIHLGLTCGQFATLMQLLDSDSFSLGTMASSEELLARLSYFAFSTIGTLGYGDVVPGSPLGESFVILVSISSTLYVSLLIGLLLSRYINSRTQAAMAEAVMESAEQNSFLP